MKILAAWLGNPGEYWFHILVLALVVAAGVILLRKLQSKKTL